jgi:hypothetical protein
VYLVELKGTDAHFAMKVLDKAALIRWLLCDITLFYVLLFVESFLFLITEPVQHNVGPKTDINMRHNIKKNIFLINNIVRN